MVVVCPNLFNSKCSSPELLLKGRAAEAKLLDLQAGRGQVHLAKQPKG